MTSSVQGCCCADGDYCNKAVALPMPTPPAEIPPIMLCYEGIYISSVGLFGHYDVCYGQCGSMNVAGLVGGSQLNVSFYSCDPIGVCKDFGLQGVNGCANLPIVGYGSKCLSLLLQTRPL